jgi:hypothetical protein
MSHEENWSYGVVEEDKPKLQPLLDALRRLRQHGLMAGMVVAVFYRRRVLPLMQHWLQIDEMTPEASLEGSQMSHESLPLDEVARCARWMVGSFKQEDIDRVPMRPTQGFEPLVSVVFDNLESFCFLIPSTKSVEAFVQDLSTVKESRPPVPEDRAAREARRLSAAQKKEEKDAAKKRQVKKTLEREALKKRRRQQSLEGLPIEESPSETVSVEDEDSSDDDAGSRYDTATFLVHLPDVRPLLEPVGGSTSRRRGKSRRPSRGKGPSGSFRVGSYLAWGPTGEVGGAAPASPIASDSIGGRSNSVGVRGQGTVNGRKDPRPDSLVSAEVLRRPVSPGSEEHPADRRLNGGALTGAVRGLGLAGV